MHQNIEACEWLLGALRGLEGTKMDPAFAKMRAVRLYNCLLFHLEKSLISISRGTIIMDSFDGYLFLSNYGTVFRSRRGEENWRYSSLILSTVPRLI